jgi:hypothetical protein
MQKSKEKKTKTVRLVLHSFTAKDRNREPLERKRNE